MAQENVINAGIFNNYTIIPKSLKEYKMYRNLIDFSQAGQFDQFETGYSYLEIIAMPKFMVVCGEQKGAEHIKNIVDSVWKTMENEFRGLSGLPDMTADSYEVGDGVNQMKFISNVTRETSVTLTSIYYERRGGMFTKFMNYYLTGIKDPITKSKQYHGLIKHGLLEPSFENEVATMLYIVTDNTHLNIEKDYLLVDCQFTKAEESMYDSTKGEIANKDLNIEWNCSLITGVDVDKASYDYLRRINGVKPAATPGKGDRVDYSIDDPEAVLDHMEYEHGIFQNPEAPNSSPSANADLYDAIRSAEKILS